MESVGILWAGVLVIVAAAVVQNFQGSAEARDRWREACRQEAEDAKERQATRERYEEARRMEREAFYQRHHGIKPDGWQPGNLVTVDRREHEKLMDWRGW